MNGFRIDLGSLSGKGAKHPTIRQTSKVTIISCLVILNCLLHCVSCPSTLPPPCTLR